VGATGFEPVTPSVSGHARPFARSVAALHSTASALLTTVTEPGAAVRRKATHRIAADKLLTAGRVLRSIFRTSVRARRQMADRCSFCGSIAGPFSSVEGLFTVLMCADCQAARGHGSSPYPAMTRAQMRAGLDLLPTWALEQKAAAFSVPRCSRSTVRADGSPLASERGRVSATGVVASLLLAWIRWTWAFLSAMWRRVPGA
jgi:hypothetical protein